MTGDKRGRWKRYSLRSLFLLMTLASLILGIWTVFVEDYRLQSRSLEAVNKLQGQVEIKIADGSEWERWLVTVFLGDDAFVQITRVDLTRKNVDDTSLLSLTGLKHLTILYLDYTHVTDKGIETVRSMPELSTLSLRYTHISGGSIEVLSELSKLQKLFLTGTNIKDMSVPELGKLLQLSELYLRWTQISDEGVRKLAKLLPNCEIYHQALAAETDSAWP